MYDLITAYLLRKLLIFAVETSPSEMEVYQPWDEGGNLIFVLWMNIHNLCWYIRAAFCLWCSNWLQSVNCVSTKRLKCPLSLLFYFSFAYSISRLHIVRIIRLGCELQRKERQILETKRGGNEKSMSIRVHNFLNFRKVGWLWSPLQNRLAYDT